MNLQNTLWIIISLITATNAHAAFTCHKPKLGEIVTKDSIYHFTATEKCEIKDVKINFAALKDVYLAEINDKKSQFKVFQQEQYNDKKGMQGYELDVMQSYKSQNGPMKVRANVLILDDQGKNFYFELRSKNIQAEGDAQYDKFILNTVELEVMDNHAQLLITKKIYIDAPWYAPRDMVVNKVVPQLLESTNKSAELNARKISGETVEALRK